VDVRVAPESIVGVGGHNHQFDGRDIPDNIQMIYQYPKKQKLISIYISTNSSPVPEVCKLIRRACV
jgi:hypothetical protein